MTCIAPTPSPSYLLPLVPPPLPPPTFFPSCLHPFPLLPSSPRASTPPFPLLPSSPRASTPSPSYLLPLVPPPLPPPTFFPSCLHPFPLLPSSPRASTPLSPHPPPPPHQRSRFPLPPPQALEVSGRAAENFWLVACLLNVPATRECISGTDLLRQFYVLPH